MQMNKILARLHAQLKVKGLTASAVSRKATGSPDTIRNWERRAKQDKNPGASSVTLAAIAATLGVPIDWLMGYGPDDLSAYDQAASEREQIMEIVDQKLTPALRSVALRQLAALVPSSGEELQAKPEPEGD